MTDQPNLDPISAMISDPFNPRNPTPPPVGPHPEFPVTRAEKAATSKTFNTLDLRIDQAIDKTWMAKEELERLVEKKAPRKVNAIAVTGEIQKLLDMEFWDVSRYEKLRSHGGYLAGLLYDSPCEQLGIVLRDALRDMNDETPARNATLALRHELTVGVC